MDIPTSTFLGTEWAWGGKRLLLNSKRNRKQHCSGVRSIEFLLNQVPWSQDWLPAESNRAETPDFAPDFSRPGTGPNFQRELLRASGTANSSTRRNGRLPRSWLKRDKIGTRRLGGGGRVADFEIAQALRVHCKPGNPES